MSANHEREPERRIGRRQWREGREATDRVFSHRLALLDGGDHYRLGDVVRRLVEVAKRARSMDAPCQSTSQPLLEALSRMDTQGLTGVLIEAGIRPVPSIRERLVRTMAAGGHSEARWHQALTGFRRDAAAAREAEFRWLARRLTAPADCVGDGDAVGRAERSLVELWFGALSEFARQDGFSLG